ncbi:MAG: thioredoxin family protein [Planctomycetes bacterium]|jgi:protein disulfide-isomerase|nr:thioredoxin family protein [Planctomycetota bacterium]
MRIASLAALLFVIPVAAQESSWLTSFEDAKAAAKKDKKVILADFTGSDWCGWCIKLKNEVFSKPEFQTWAEKNVILLELDFPKNVPQSDDIKAQNKELAKKYGIKGYPTILFLDAEGKQIGTLGYKPGGPAAWTKLADEQIKGGAAGGGEIADAASEEGWITSYKAALAKAKKEKKVILADFTGTDWCGWCIKLKDEVFSKPEFKEWADKNVVLLEVDFPRKKKQSPELKKQNQDLAQEFGIQGYPTIVFLDAKGKKLGNLGYAEGGPAAWIALAEKEIGKKSKK